MGACLDLLRDAARFLGTEANAVSDNPLVFAEEAEALSGGNFHAEPVAFAADMIAIAVCEIGSIAERPYLRCWSIRPCRGCPRFSRPTRPQFGFMIAQVTGRGTGVRKQTASVSGECGFHPDFRESRRITSRWRPMSPADCCR